MCDYKISARAELDQENTKNALEELNIFITRYAYSPKVRRMQWKMITVLQDKLVDKSHNNAKLYYDMKKYKAAVVAINNSLKQYPASAYREEMMFLKLNSLYLYAVKSFADKQKTRYQDTLDELFFHSWKNFRKASIPRMWKSIFQKTNKYLKQGIPV